MGSLRWRGAVCSAGCTAPLRWSALARNSGTRWSPGPFPSPTTPGSITYTPGFLTALRQLLRQPRPEVVIASSLPNARLSDFAEVMSWLGTAFPFPAGAAAFAHAGFEDAVF